MDYGLISKVEVIRILLMLLEKEFCSSALMGIIGISYLVKMENYTLKPIVNLMMVVVKLKMLIQFFTLVIGALRILVRIILYSALEK